MNIGNVLIPIRGSPKQLAIGCLILFGFLIYLITEAYCTRKVGFKESTLAPYCIFDRDKDPINYWLAIIFYAAGAIGAAWLLLEQVP